jgi:hypothetical protein
VMRPKGLQSVCGPNVCSICSDNDVYYSKMESFDEEVEIRPKVLITVVNWGCICYCKDCYEDCGGMLRLKD